MTYSYNEIRDKISELGPQLYNLLEVPEWPPDEQELSPYQLLLDTEFLDLKRHIRKKMSAHRNKPGHGFGHLEIVALTAGYLADRECDFLDIDLFTRRSIVRESTLAGLLHDTKRHLGIERHSVQGMYLAQDLLKEHHHIYLHLPRIIEHHDNFDFFLTGDETFDITFGSLWDADKIWWGLERGKTFWDDRQEKGVLPEEAIHDYHYLAPVIDSFRTLYGQYVGKKIIEYAIILCKGIERAYMEESLIDMTIDDFDY